MGNSIIDLVIQIKNGYMARKDDIESFYSKYKEEVLKKLKALGYIKDYQVIGDKVKKITVTLLYHDSVPAVTQIKLFSKPGRRWYTSKKDLKPVVGGMGYAILSTPNGVMTHIEAKKKNIGGELLFNIW